MNEPEILKDQQVQGILQEAAGNGAEGVLSFLTRGKWHMVNVTVVTAADRAIHLEIDPQFASVARNIQIEQPVGFSFRCDHSKYIFESQVIGVEDRIGQDGTGRVMIQTPRRIERMQRRSFTRVNVPESIRVQVMFWHRGYADETEVVPAENCWQGDLVDLSAGGMQISISAEQGPNFRPGQLVGMQFTPMVYEKPLLVEGQVRHIAQTADEKRLYLGVEFVGLEATYEGRLKLRRITEVVRQYYEQGDAVEQEPLFGFDSVAVNSAGKAAQQAMAAAQEVAGTDETDSRQTETDEQTVKASNTTQNTAKSFLD